MRLVVIMLALALVPAVAEAGKWLDYLRKYDLNDYAIGLAVTTSENPYFGASNSTFAYPYLTSLEHPALTDSWFVFRNGGIEARRITSGGWEFAVAGRIQTLGFGNHDSDRLRGMSVPKWTVELGPAIGLRRWPVQIHLNALVEPTNRHDGVTSTLSLSYPMGWSRGYLVPAIQMIYQDSDYTEYYFGVDSDEILPIRPEYVPGDAVNTKVKIEWGYELTEKWLLSGTLSLENLADNIQDSPIVDSKELWSVKIGLAYNADIFNPSGYEFVDADAPRFDFRIGLFNTHVNSKIGRETTDGVPVDEIDLEEEFGESDRENVVQLEAIWRIGRYHRLEAGFFELVRDGRTIVIDELQHGDSVYAPDTELQSRSHFKSLRFGYAYSLIRDSQKELGVMAGVHYASFDSIISDGEPDANKVEARLDAPLPVVGVHASANIGNKTSVSAKLQFFRTDFDTYEGLLNYFTVDVQRQFGESVNLGIGYNYYYMKLRSRDENLNGFVEIEYRGPVIFLGYNF